MSSKVQAVVDPQQRTATITTRFERPIDVVWTLFSDPDKLARWWGPPGVPMTVDHHDLVLGGRVDVAVHLDPVIRGRWSILWVEPPRFLRFTFASHGLEPTEIDVRLESESDDVTTMTVTARFTSDGAFGLAIDIGFVDGLARSVEAAGSHLAQ